MICDLTDPCFSTERQGCFVNIASLSTLANALVLEATSSSKILKLLGEGRR